MSPSPLGVSLLTAFLFATSAAAQSPRDQVQLNSIAPASAGNVGIHSADDLTAVVWMEGIGSKEGGNPVYVATSDGRGVTFGAAVRIDSNNNFKTVQRDSVRVVGNTVYVTWESQGDLFFARSLDRGLTYSAPVVVDDGGGSLRKWRFEMSPDSAGDHLYLLSMTSVLDDDLFLATSHDGGASFSSAVSVPVLGAVGDVDNIGLACSGTTAHVAWDDNRSGRDSVYYQRTADGGSTFLGADVLLGDNAGVEDAQSPIEVAVHGSTLAVFWQEEPTGSGNESPQVNASIDGGLTFQGPVNPSTSVGADGDLGDVIVDPYGRGILVTWEDNRTGSDEAFVAVSSDGGLTFAADIQVSNTGASEPYFCGAAAGRSAISVVWSSAVSNPRSAESCLSLDGGASWKPQVTMSGNPLDSVVEVTGTYNELYGNFIAAWSAFSGAESNALAGGYRPQTLDGQNLISGSPSSFGLADFRGAEPLAWVLLSAAPGSLPVGFGDLRDLGLNPLGTIFVLSATQPGVFLIPLTPGGTGATPPVGNPLPPGFVIYGAAISLSIGATVQLGELTDVEMLTTL